jgi:hypothetical protein
MQDSPKTRPNGNNLKYCRLKKCIIYAITLCRNQISKQYASPSFMLIKQSASLCFKTGVVFFVAAPVR